jgi:hypothetical protein
MFDWKHVAPPVLFDFCMEINAALVLVARLESLRVPARSASTDDSSASSQDESTVGSAHREQS